MRFWGRDQLRVPRGERRASGDRRPIHRTILDFGSTAVRALVVEVEEGGATVLGYGRAVLGLGLAEPQAEGLRQAAEAALTQAEDATEDVVGRKVVPDLALLGLSGWFVRGRSVTVRHNRRQPGEPISEGEVQGVFQRAQRLARREAHRSGGLEGRLRSLFTGVWRCEVDGRAVTSPLGFRGSTLDARVFSAFAPEGEVGELRGVAEALELSVVGVLPVPCGLAVALEGRDALLIDIGGRWTDLIVVRGGHPVACGSLGWGGSHLTQALADTFRVGPARGEESKLAYAAGELDGRSARRIQDVLSGPGGAWLEGVAGLAGHLCREEAGPHRILVCGGGSLLPDAMEGLRAYPWMESVRLERYPEVGLLTARALTGVRDRTGRLDGPEAVPTLSLARFAAGMEGRAHGLEALLGEVAGEGDSEG